MKRGGPTTTALSNPFFRHAFSYSVALRAKLVLLIDHPHERYDARIWVTLLRCTVDKIFADAGKRASKARSIEAADLMTFDRVLARQYG